MPHSPFEPITLLGTTPKIKKVRRGAVALSPVAPLVAETGRLDDGSDVLRITDYQTGAVEGQTAIPINLNHCHILSFSPDGKRLLALDNFWNTLQVYSEDSAVSQTIYDQHNMSSIFHAT